MPASVRTSTATWPEGVIARYLTKAAEISGQSITVDTAEESDQLVSTCGGCGTQHVDSFDPMCEGIRMENYARDGARMWAQSHAGNCRALPRPTT
ncbi:hypothetical protein ACGFZR_15255 [Streptomyces sp. NPDC048241]|uniref:hypothetical protein n=1 Tax=Streptomyces sp. NPDC048241 TaxID=3365521 RepID=UPI003716F7B2